MSAPLYLDAMDYEQEERLLESPRRDTRAKPKYPSKAPDGRSWEQYFADYRASLRAISKEPVAAEPVVVLQPLRSLGTDECPGTIRRVAQRLLGRDWEVSVRASVVSMPAVRYVTDSDDHSAGDIRYQSYDLDTYVLLGVLRAPDGQVGLALDATWMRKAGAALSFKTARTFDPILGHEIRVGLRKGRARNDIEDADDIDPPIGLEEWLAIVAPTVKKATKAKKEERDGSD